MREKEKEENFFLLQKKKKRNTFSGGLSRPPPVCVCVCVCVCVREPTTTHKKATRAHDASETTATTHDFCWLY